jgi:hypothetical protein
MSPTRGLRLKYLHKPYGSGLFSRRPPGGDDVIQLCDLCDRLESIVRDCQRRLPNEQQNEIEGRLWAAFSDSNA